MYSYRQDKTNSQMHKKVKPENTNTDNFSATACEHRQNYSFADLFNGVIIFPLNSVINLYIQVSKLTLARLPEASSNCLGQVIFWLNLPGGLANEIQSIKQNQARLFKDAI